MEPSHDLGWAKTGAATPRLREMLPRTPGWRDQAACHGTDPDIFEPGMDQQRLAVAMLYCHGDDTYPACPVRDSCLVMGLLSGDKSIVWGGLTPIEMRDARRRVHASSDTDRVVAAILDETRRATG